MMKKLHWLIKTKNEWKVLLKIGDEIYRVRVLTNRWRDSKYTLYKYERYDDQERVWTADVTKCKSQIKSKTPIIVFNSIRSIFLSHINMYKPDNVLYTINIDDGNVEKRDRINRYFLRDLENLDYRSISTSQFKYRAFFAIKNHTIFSDKPSSFFKIMFHEIQIKVG